MTKRIGSAMTSMAKPLIERLREHLSTLAPHVADRKTAMLLHEAVDALEHSAAGVTPAAQDTKPLEALSLVERAIAERTRWDSEVQDALAMVRTALELPERPTEG
jgi:hypothetical protein